MQNPEKLLQRLDWTIVRRLDGLLQGDYRTLFHGFGLELTDLREYQFSDDVRFIDWNVTARMQTPYVRKFNEDREVTLWFLLDLSPSVDFGTVHMLKRNLLIDFVALLARLFTRHGNRIGAVFYSGKIERVIPARGGKPQVLRLINDLLSQPQLKHTTPTNLAILLETALRIIRRRSLVFIVSDFISTPGWDRPLNILTRQHEVLAVRLFDPREMELPDIGFTTFEDAETGEQLCIDTHDRMFQKRFIEAARRREYELNTTFARSSVDLLTLSTEDDLVREIIRFATLRKQRKKVPAAFARSGAQGVIFPQREMNSLKGRVRV